MSKAPIAPSISSRPWCVYVCVVTLCVSVGTLNRTRTKHLIRSDEQVITTTTNSRLLRIYL